VDPTAATNAAPSKRRKSMLALGVTLFLATCGMLAAFRLRAGSPLSCLPDRAEVLVDTQSRKLALCENGVNHGQYTVRLGFHGVGKSREGDSKTPLGTYSLGRARNSIEHGQFALIGYPTEAQKAQGYTGSAVGIHGPKRDARWLGVLVNVFNTTDGCVGLATDAEMKAVALWLTDHHVREIRIR
jgi:L,D-peptidoglycan transpeptidase YkuD (ErfK/YbiS/YcfS/YnhG family)